VIPGYIDRMTPNAVADYYGARHFIAMHQALLVTMTEFALFVFTQREIFPSVGEAAAEDSPSLTGDQAPGVLLLERTLLHRSIEISADQRRVPKGAERHVAAVYMALLMARFVWMHEMAH